MDLLLPISTFCYILGSICLTKYYSEIGYRGIFRSIVTTFDSLREIGYEVQNVGQAIPNFDAPPEDAIDPEIRQQRHDEEIYDEGPRDITAGARDLREALNGEAQRIENKSKYYFYFGVSLIILGFLLNISPLLREMISNCTY